MENNDVVLNETELEENYTVVSEPEERQSNGGVALLFAGGIAVAAAVYKGGKLVVRWYRNTEFAKKQQIKSANRKLVKAEKLKNEAMEILNKTVETETTEETED